MAVTTNKTQAVGWRTCLPVMLAQAGSPPRTRIWRDRVGIFYTAMTPHTGNEVRTVRSGVGNAEVCHSDGCSFAAVTVVAAAANSRIIQVGVVETVSPGMALSRRYVAFVIPEAGVALGAASHVVRIV
jgi:hypothetical protein